MDETILAGEKPRFFQRIIEAIRKFFSKQTENSQLNQGVTDAISE